MTDDVVTAEAPRRGRPPRAKEERRERRMKPGDLVNPSVKLTLNEDALDRDTFEYRWVNDTPGRIAHMKRMDYDIVSDEAVKTDGNGAGTVPTVHGGTGDDGKPYGMVLMAKYKDWHQDDQKRKQAALDQMDANIRRGTAHRASGENDLAEDGVTYTPGTGNTISVRNSR